MTAVTYQCYGGPEVLQLSQISKPEPGPEEVLVKVHYAGVNPLDWHYMRGSPYIMRLGSGIGAPTDSRLGVDFAGVVESVGEDVIRVDLSVAVSAVTIPMSLSLGCRSTSTSAPAAWATAARTVASTLSPTLATATWSSRSSLALMLLWAPSTKLFHSPGRSGSGLM